MPDPHARSEFVDALRKGLLLGAAFLMLVLPPTLRAPTPGADRDGGPRVVATPRSGPGPDFGDVNPTPDVRRMAGWVLASGDHQRKSFVIIDKKDARVYLFDPRGRLQSTAPALLGAYPGDDSAPGVGDKPIAEVKPEEKTTPAGRFVAELGTSSSRGEDVVWIDYNAAVSMHRVLNVPARLQALSSPTSEDNRMSFGCVNLPPPFYENVLRPAVERTGAIIYVLPETRPLRETFASFHDVTAPVKLAQH